MFERREREMFLRPTKKPIDESPKVIGDKWIQFCCTDFATRERRTKVLLCKDEISEVKQNYDLDQYDNKYWCDIVMCNGKVYDVKATYEEVVEILRGSDTHG